MKAYWRGGCIIALFLSILMGTYSLVEAEDYASGAIEGVKEHPNYYLIAGFCFILTIVFSCIAKHLEDEEED